MPPTLPPPSRWGRVGEGVDGRPRCKSGNVKFAVTSMNQKMAILTEISLPIRPLTNFLTIGSAQCVAHPKICLKKLDSQIDGG